MEVSKFRYDINGLRAIAVISVVLFHYHIPGFSGGFCGVDVFFVISGYLMTSIILGGINKNKFSYIEFYKRRVERIVPALIFLLLILTIVGSFFYFPSDFKLNEQYATASLLFVSNILYWRTLNYFGPTADTNILLHTWSLSVEWQFYLLYPVLLVWVSKLKAKNKYLIFLITATVVPFVFTVFFVKISPVATFYLIPTRAWEMFFGGIAFTLTEVISIGNSKRYLAISGYGLIIASIVLLNSTYSWPGAFTFAPVFGTFLVIIANQNNFAILKNQVVQLTGKISYSLYLWHWPVLIIFKYMGFDIGYTMSLILFGISVAFAYLSYRLIERSLVLTVSKRILTAAAFTLIITGLLSVFKCNQIFFNKKALYFSAFTQSDEDNKKQFSDGGCFFITRDKAVYQPGFIKSQCLTFDKTKKNILIIGDSHCAELSSSLKQVFAEKGVNMMQATLNSWLPLETPIQTAKDQEIADYVFHNFIASNFKSIDGVILDGNWVDEYPDLNKLSARLNATIAYLNKYGLKVMVIGQTEGYTMPYPIVLAKGYQYHRDLGAHYLNKDAAATNQFLAKKLSGIYVDIYNTNIPPVSKNNEPYMFDPNHLTEYGAGLAVKKIFSDPIAVKFFN